MTAFHHNPLELPAGSRTLAVVVYIADRIVGKLDYGFRGDLPDLEIDPAIMLEIGITQEQIAKIEQAMPQAYEEVEATFG